LFVARNAGYPDAKHRVFTVDDAAWLWNLKKPISLVPRRSWNGSIWPNMYTKPPLPFTAKGAKCPKSWTGQLN
jgi:hypothetical protein